MKPQSKQRTVAGRVSTGSPVGFSKRTVTPTEFAWAAASVLLEAPTFYRIWVGHSLDPGFREKLMLAVARFNEAKYCGWAHHEWALIENVPETEIASVERMDAALLDRRTHVAISFVRQLVAAGFGPVSKEILQEMRIHFAPGEIEEIGYVAKVMNVMNLGSNTFDAFVSRLNGIPSRGRIVDEAIMSAIFCCALPPLYSFFSQHSGLSADDLAHRMVDYARAMDAGCMEHGAPGKRTAPVLPHGTASRRRARRAADV